MSEPEPIGVAIARIEALRMVECSKCSEPGTWERHGGEPMCPDCRSQQPDKLREAELHARRETWKLSLARLGVPAKHQDVPRNLRIAPELKDWNGRPWSVTLLGYTGTGKTWLATWLLGALYCRGLDDCEFIDYSMTLEAMKREFDQDHAGIARNGIFRRVANRGALLVDDLGAERDTDWTRDRTGMLLRERYNRQRPTIITINVPRGADERKPPTLADIAELVDPRITSRLAEGVVLTLTGRDRRIKEARS